MRVVGTILTDEQNQKMKSIERRRRRRRRESLNQREMRADSSNHSQSRDLARSEPIKYFIVFLSINKILL